MDMMVGSPAAVPSLPLPPPRPAAHCGAVRAPHHSARSRCPSRPATHSEASMRRTLISYYSFYTQQGRRPVLYGVPYDSWWQLRGSTQVDAVSPGLVNPPPTQPLNGLHHILPPTDHPDTTGCNLSKKSVIFSCACTVLVTNPSQLANANIQIFRVPMIQICAIDAIVELSASLPGDAPAYQSGFNFSF